MITSIRICKPGFGIYSRIFHDEGLPAVNTLEFTVLLVYSLGGDGFPPNNRRWIPSTAQISYQRPRSPMPIVTYYTPDNFQKETLENEVVVADHWSRTRPGTASDPDCTIFLDHDDLRLARNRYATATLQRGASNHQIL